MTTGAASWWVWGISSWIGHGGWCDGVAGEQRPQRTNVPGEQFPYVSHKRGGQGVSAQRDAMTLPSEQDEIPWVASDKRPHRKAARPPIGSSRASASCHGSRLSPSDSPRSSS